MIYTADALGASGAGYDELQVMMLTMVTSLNVAG